MITCGIMRGFYSVLDKKSKPFVWLWLGAGQSRQPDGREKSGRLDGQLFGDGAVKDGIYHINWNVTH